MAEQQRFSWSDCDVCAFAVGRYRHGFVEDLWAWVEDGFRRNVDEFPAPEHRLMERDELRARQAPRWLNNYLTRLREIEESIRARIPRDKDEFTDWDMWLRPERGAADSNRRKESEAFEALCNALSIHPRGCLNFGTLLAEAETAAVSHLLTVARRIMRTSRKVGIPGEWIEDVAEQIMVAIRVPRGPEGFKQHEELRASIGALDEQIRAAIKSVSGVQDGLSASAAEAARSLPSKQVRWDDGDPAFIPGSEVIKLSDGAITLQRLSKLLRRDGVIRYMRHGQRCRVHVHDFRQYLKQRKDTDRFDRLDDDEYAEHIGSTFREIRREKLDGK